MKFETKRILYSLYFPVLLALLLWIILYFRVELHVSQCTFGIYPRHLDDLSGILTSPLIHADLNHLFSNTVPLILLGWCLFYSYRDLGYAVLLIVWILSGFFTWLIGRESCHIGASGLIYGLAFFLFFSGIFRNHIPLMAISLLVTFLYGSLVFGMLPISQLVYENISWEGHLSGALTGLICAVVLINKGPQKPPSPFEDEEEEEETPPSNSSV